MSLASCAAPGGGAKADRTRATLLAAAERVFADRGYAAARLEDVAARVGIRRASIVYHFRDKRALYEAVLADIFGALLERYRLALGAPVPLPRRIEAVVEAWVDYVAERPTVARLLLWETAEGSPARAAVSARHADQVIAAITDAVREGQRQGLFRPIDPVHLIFTIVGATVFFVTAAARMVPDLVFDPFSPAQLDAHRAELLEIARRLLGSGAAPPPTRPGEEEPPCR